MTIPDGRPYSFDALSAGFCAPGETAILELEFDVGSIVATLDGTTGSADDMKDTIDLFSAGGVFPAGATTASVRILQATMTDSNGNDHYVHILSLQIVETNRNRAAQPGRNRADRSATSKIAPHCTALVTPLRTQRGCLFCARTFLRG